MATRPTLVLTAILAAIPAIAGGQRYTPPPPPLAVDPCAIQPNPRFATPADPKAKPPVCPPPAAATPGPATAPAATPSAADQFPFPGSPSSTAPAAQAPAKTTAPTSAADRFPYPGSTTPPAAPSKGTPAEKFPYPGETTKSPDAVPEGNTPRYTPDAPPSSSGESSSSSSSTTDPTSAEDPKDDPKPAPITDPDLPTAKKGRRPLPKVSAQSADERVTEDLTVAKFYTDRGNFQAAYLRSKDATHALPNDPEGHFALAQAAQRLQKKDEAVAEYTLYLQLDPAGDHIAAARRALTELR